MYHRLRKSNHPDCVACSSNSKNGLMLDFRIVDDGVVEASFACDMMFQGYPAVLHGGIVSTLLDSAMTNCLFANGLAAMTVDLHVRFRHPVTTGRGATVRAWIASSNRPVHEMAGELIQNGTVKATAKARFLENYSANWVGKRDSS